LTEFFDIPEPSGTLEPLNLWDFGTNGTSEAPETLETLDWNPVM